MPDQTPAVPVEVTLLPCPFCGDSATLQAYGAEDQVVCTNCNASTARLYCDPPGRAIAAWNRRSPSPTAPGVPRVAGEADWCRQAAIYTDNKAGNVLPARDMDGVTIEHASWMLGEIISGDVTGRKAHRWLGYAQAILVMAGCLTLEEAKLCNKRASDEAALTAVPAAVSSQGEVARELLAAEYERDNEPNLARLLKAPGGETGLHFGPALRAIERALSRQPSGQWIEAIEAADHPPMSLDSNEGEE